MSNSQQGMSKSQVEGEGAAPRCGMSRPCIFFDRDGVVNVSPGPGYVERWEDFHLQTGFVEALRIARARGQAVVIVTNQRGVARGIMAVETVETIHRRLRETLREQYALDVDDILYCPHENGTCDCRKPQPGMLLTAAARHEIDMGASWMIGDSQRDVEAGRRAGCRTIFIGTGADDGGADLRADDMDQLPTVLERALGS